MTRSAQTPAADAPPGVRIRHLDDVPWAPPAPRAGRDPEQTRASGVLEKWFVQPGFGENRFPVSAVRFQPDYEFPSHWHTEGELILILAGAATVGDEEVGVGGLAYNDRYTIYGAEAAGPQGCDFLMIRRARARNTVVLTEQDVADAMAQGVVNSLDQVATTAEERGLHTFDLDALPWETEPATGLRVQWLMRPDPAGDRPPAAIVAAPREAVTWDRPEFSLLLWVLSGEAVVDGRRIGAQTSVYVDAGASVSLAAAEGSECRLLAVAPIAAPEHQVAP